MPGTAPRIGTLKETPLHAALKRWYAQPGDRLEVPVDGFVVDLVRGHLLIEVQTSGFSSMKRKLATLLEAGHRVRVVHPIARDKWIVKLGEDGTVLSRRLSPKHGSTVDVFGELVSFPGLVAHPGLEIEILLIAEEELRRHEPGKAWRRRGWVVDERRLIEVYDTDRLRSPDDLAALLPADVPEIFTTADVAERLATPRRIAQQMAYCLREAGAITAVGKQGNAIEYIVVGGV